jgi:biopolymer transport protein TolR
LIFGLTASLDHFRIASGLQKIKRTEPTMGVAVRDEGKKVNSNINVTPMVDVMLVLLIIFMVITPMLQNKVQIDMAKVDNPTSMPDADKDDAIVVAVTRDGAVFLGQNKVDPSQLGSLVRDKLQDKTDKTIYIRADARAQYRAVEDAIDDVRTAGVEEVGLLTQKREGNGLAGGE